MLRGFDASSVQGAIPFWLLSKDHRFCILKAQQGNDGFDPSFTRNVTEALKNGIEPFAYCFAYPLHDDGKHPGRDPREQARLFVDRVTNAHVSMHGRPIFLDFEWPEPINRKRWGVDAAFLAGWCAACAEEVEIYSGVTPILYTYWDWWEEHLVNEDADVSWASLYPLWMADYWGRGWPQPGDSPKLPKPWAEWLFWQFDGNGGLRLPNGVDADFCVFNGDEGALARLAHTTVKPRPADSVEGSAAVTTITRP